MVRTMLCGLHRMPPAQPVQSRVMYHTHQSACAPRGMDLGIDAVLPQQQQQQPSFADKETADLCATLNLAVQHPPPAASESSKSNGRAPAKPLGIRATQQQEASAKSAIQTQAEQGPVGGAQWLYRQCAAAATSTPGGGGLGPVDTAASILSILAQSSDSSDAQVWGA